MNIKLWYGYGFSGKSYSLQINDEYFSLGMNYTEDEAKEKSVEILKQKNINADLSKVDFNWDGTL